MLFQRANCSMKSSLLACGYFCNSAFSIQIIQFFCDLWIFCTLNRNWKVLSWRTAFKYHINSAVLWLTCSSVSFFSLFFWFFALLKYYFTDYSVLVCCGGKRAELKGNTFNLQLDLSSNPHLWSWAVDTSPRIKSSTQVAEISFYQRPAGFSHGLDRMRSSVIQDGSAAADWRRFGVLGGHPLDEVFHTRCIRGRPQGLGEAGNCTDCCCLCDRVPDKPQEKYYDIYWILM